MVEHKLGGCDRAARCSADVHWFEAGKRLCVVGVTASWLGQAVTNMDAGRCASSKDFRCQDCRDMVGVVDVCCPIGC